MASLNDTILTSTGSDTITLNNNSASIWNIPAVDTITFSNQIASSSTYNSGVYVNTTSGTASAPFQSTYTINNNVNSVGRFPNSHNGKPFVDNFPGWDAFRKLCDEYPGLERAYQNLKTFYTMCYADSILPKDDK